MTRHAGDTDHSDPVRDAQPPVPRDERPTPEPARDLSKAELAERRTVIDGLIEGSGGDPGSFQGRLVREMVESCLKLFPDGHDTGQMKLINSALKELRYAYRVFNGYAHRRKVSIFGSARTPEDHPDYIAARDYGELMARHGWMAITGAGDGIMKAGHEGPRSEHSFGLSIRLPFETTANEVIEGDPKLINFRYFFTRKVMFLTHADAIAVFPGGYGTQDELFEALVLVQTGKSNIVPIVLLDGEGGVYWDHWVTYIEKNLLDNGWISGEDPGLFFHARTPQQAVDHVLAFYRVYHSCRYVGDRFVLRVQRAPTDAELAELNEDFAGLLASGSFERSGALDGETEHRDLPRIVFHHNRYHYGLIRRLIDRVNGFGVASAAGGAGAREG